MNVYQLSYQMKMKQRIGDLREIQSIQYIDDRVREESLEEIGEFEDENQQNVSDGGLSRQVEEEDENAENLVHQFSRVDIVDD